MKNPVLLGTQHDKLIQQRIYTVGAQHAVPLRQSQIAFLFQIQLEQINRIGTTNLVFLLG